MSKNKFNISNLIVAILLVIAGSAYLIFLHGMFPKFVPFHGGSESFWLSEANNFTFQITWSAFSRLYLNLQSNDTIELYKDGNYVCICSHYGLMIERGDEALIFLKSKSPVKGKFTARQEIPLENQLLSFIMLLTGIIGLVQSIARRPI